MFVVYLILFLILTSLIYGLVWWLIFETEGVYLGRGAVIWLYDLYAKRYDAIKENDEEMEIALIARPLMSQIAPQTDPLVLDVALGTGRMPIALTQLPYFEGHVVGLDLSLKMLEIASEKVKAAGIEERVTLIHESAEKLPFPENSFDVVTCMEALEFIPHPEGTLAELVRVLRPSGLLLITNRQNAPLMPGKIWSEDELATLLEKFGIEFTEIEAWQLDYKKVWGQKAGESESIGTNPLNIPLICPKCNQSQLKRVNNTVWQCSSCDEQVSVNQNGILEYFPAK